MSAARKVQKRTAPAKAPVSAFRRSMIAKINIAKAQLRMDEDDYRAGLTEVTGRSSLTKCSDKQLTQVLEWLASKGFRPVQSKGAATHPMARKARALWISLYHLGAVDNPSDHALEAFATRQLKCERLVWANQREAFRLIEALKSWSVRADWPEAGTTATAPILLQASLCRAILAKLKAAGIAKPGWDLTGAAMQLLGWVPPMRAAGDEPMTSDDYQRLAEQLGRLLRRHAGAAQSPLTDQHEDKPA